jgi:predicted adenylyl cyclase CyaB
MKNLEVKATAHDLAAFRRRLREMGAVRQRRLLEQADWYFAVPAGRLKLRQQKGETAAELILYLRPDARKTRTSEYQKLPAADAAGLLRLLKRMFALDVCIRKRRELWLHGRTRVHLDEVEGLGAFVEIEVPFVRNVQGARRAARALIDGLGIAPADLLASSYADLLAGGNAGPGVAGSGGQR